MTIKYFEWNPKSYLTCGIQHETTSVLTAQLSAECLTLLLSTKQTLCFALSHVCGCNSIPWTCFLFQEMLLSGQVFHQDHTNNTDATQEHGGAKCFASVPIWRMMWKNVWDTAEDVLSETLVLRSLCCSSLTSPPVNRCFAWTGVMFCSFPRSHSNEGQLITIRLDANPKAFWRSFQAARLGGSCSFPLWFGSCHVAETDLMYRSADLPGRLCTHTESRLVSGSLSSPVVMTVMHSHQEVSSENSRVVSRKQNTWTRHFRDLQFCSL